MFHKQVRQVLAMAAVLAASVVATPPATADTVTPMSGSGLFEIIAKDPNGNIRAFQNVNGLSGPTYPRPAQLIGSGWANVELKFGDIDGDTYDDMISVNAGGSGEVRAWRNVNGRYPGGGVVIGTGWRAPHRTFFGDIDGDRKDEIILINDQNTVLAWRNVSGFSGPHGPYTAGSQVIGSGFTFPGATYFADIDGDNRDEIINLHQVVVGGSRAEIWAWPNVNGLSGPNGPYTGGHRVIGDGWNYSFPEEVKFADLDNDKRHELIHVPYFGGNVRAWRNVNGFNGFPYPEAPKEIGQGWNANQTFFGEILN